MIGAMVSVNVTWSAAETRAAAAINSPINLERMALLCRFGARLGLGLELVVREARETRKTRLVRDASI